MSFSGLLLVSLEPPEAAWGEHLLVKIWKFHAFFVCVCVFEYLNSLNCQTNTGKFTN